MKERSIIEEFVNREMSRLDYSPKSIGIYKAEILKLNDFFVNKDLEDISFEEINSYIQHLQSDRLKVSASVINQALHAFALLYNKIWNKDFDFNSIKRPSRHRGNPDILTPEEILSILDVTNNLQHKLIIAIAYSAGLDLSEVRNLRLIDIDSIRDTIKIRDSRGKPLREAVLARYVKTMFEKHLKQNKPQKFIFESSRTGMEYSDTTIRRILVRAAVKAGITKKITFKTLKYSYVTHLNELGYPIQFTLRQLKMKSAQSLVFFSDVVNRNKSPKPFSPLDKITLKTEIEHPINKEYLEQAIMDIVDKDEADYLKEALVCMNFGSLRAGIIFAWNAAVLNLRKKCFRHGIITLNSAVKKYKQNAKEIKNIEDFSYINDTLLLLIAQELGEVDKGEKDSLEDCLDTRNKCGHPGNHKPKALKAASFMEELITIVFK